MKKILKPDELTNGALTSMIEQSWQEKKQGNSKSVSPNELKNINQSLLNYKMFYDVAENIYVPFEKETDIRDPNKHVTPFGRNGLVIDDDIYAANGRFKSIYTCKGIRTIWFNDGTIELFSLHSTIESTGFTYDLEEIGSFPSQDPGIICENQYKTDDNYFGLIRFISPSYLINRLSRITKVYEKDFYLEYLLNPPDVSLLSSYSLKLKRDLWESIISLVKEITTSFDAERFDLLIFVVEFMTEAEIEPANDVMVDLFQFIQENKTDNQNHLYKELFEKMKGQKESSQEGKKLNEKLIEELKKVISGTNDAKEYEKVIVKIVERLFKPYLKDPNSQVRTEDGREIIDITLYNEAAQGFWHDMKLRYGASIIYIECKNMDELANEEFQQISSRLSTKKGMFGILISRKSDNLDLLRAYRVLYHQEKIIINLTDEDLIDMLENFYTEEDYPTLYLSKKYRVFTEKS
ncbi:hypothetical protein SRABI80_04618 [Peribacillus frigoritolerans]|uniref:hypothetical protein n=1 Tax=Peribacillus frigoritolerans TaxID=450367 RepID=UPI001E0A7986|nr:hypothetical protein [Peribacillus frigoritolerans]CAH0313971.1 hypothetical protein SRABI80_04618 [Peribacillus frigoritolerans]